MSEKIKISKLPSSVKNALKKKEKVKKKKTPDDMFAGFKGIPGKIVIDYDQTIPYSRVDKTIKFKFKMLKNKIPDKEKEINFLEEEKTKKKNQAEKKYLEKQIIKLKNEVEDYKHDKSLNEYISSTKDILKQLMSGEEDEELMDRYFLISRKYLKIDIIKKIKEENNCINCGEELDDDINIDNVLVCPNCDAINTVMKLTKLVRDVEYGNTVCDEDVVNFIKVLDKFEGKNSTPIHEELYQELDEYMDSIGHNKGEYYRDKPLNSEGKKDGTSRRLLWQALGKLGYNQYYDEASRICHIYWGWKLPDLSHYRDQLIEDYQKTQTVWKKIKSGYPRSASLGTQYRLYKQLLAVGFPNYEKEDFRIQDMTDSIRLHDRAWKNMCEEAGVKFFETGN